MTATTQCVSSSIPRRRLSESQRFGALMLTTCSLSLPTWPNTVSPQGRLHQVEYALEAVKQGSCVVGLRSKTHAVLVALKRAPSELASYQKKMLRIDNHIGIGFAGLTSDARVLSNYMRQLALSSRLVYSRPLPLSRIISSLADRAQLNTMQYGKRPYGVGFLVVGVDGTGPHLYEFSPTGNCFEYYAMSLGARSQSSKTYLERNLDGMQDLTREELIIQGLVALRESLQQGKEVSRSVQASAIAVNRAWRKTFGWLTNRLILFQTIHTHTHTQLEQASVSVAVVGPGADADASSPESRGADKFKVYEGEELASWLSQ